MYPILFELSLPSFLANFFGPKIEIYSYGVSIGLGALLGYLYILKEMRLKFNASEQLVSDLSFIIIIMSFIGGKIFFYLEDPSYYRNNPSEVLNDLRAGFVFYGSFLFAVPTALWFLKKKKIPLLPCLDIFAILACILHFFGRFGCFCSGCCHGKPYDGNLAITFIDPSSVAPLNTPLYPTQIFSMIIIFLIACILFILKKHQKFNGQIFLSYIILYATARSFLENYRGDEERGFIINGLVSHSQFISFLMIIAAFFYYFKLNKNKKINI